MSYLLQFLVTIAAIKVERYIRRPRKHKVKKVKISNTVRHPSVSDPVSSPVVTVQHQ